jgi:glycerophosphoryl diester phosphodiesterase
MRSSLDSDFFGAPLPRIFGHRGSAGTHPENTMVSFQVASHDPAYQPPGAVHGE